MYQKILVPVDGSTTSAAGLAEAIRLAQLTQGQLRLVHVVDELSFAMSMDAYVGRVNDWLEELRGAGGKVLAAAQAQAAAAGIPCETVLRDSFKGAVQEIVTGEAASWPADLIVIGTHGRRGVGRLMMGSSAEQVCRLATVPVLLIRSPEAPTEHVPSEKLVDLHVPSGSLAYE